MSDTQLWYMLLLISENTEQKNLHLLLDKQAILFIKISYTKTHLLHTTIDEKQRKVGHKKMEKGT